MIPSPTNPIRSDIFKSFYLFNLVDCAVECIFHRFQHDSDWRLFMYAKLILLVKVMLILIRLLSRIALL